jgi:hypothetical protein
MANKNDNIETELNNIINIYNDRESDYRDININTEEFSEEFITKLIFSNYINEKIKNISNEKYIQFIIGNNNFAGDNNRILVETKYYGSNFNIINNNESTQSDLIFFNKNMQDFDISFYASENVKNYLFLFDTLSEIYKYAGKKIDDINDEIKVRTRYYYDSFTKTIKLYRNNEYDTVILKISRNTDIYTNVEKFSFATSKDYHLFGIFKKDIEKHLKFLNQIDVKEGAPEYIDNVVHFYKYCKILLEYIIIHSLNISGNYINDTYLKKSINNVFFNVLEHIRNSDLNTDNISHLYNSKVLNSKRKLSKINKENEENAFIINDNRKKIKKYEDKYKHVSNIYLFTIILFSVIFITYFTLLFISIDKNFIKLIVFFLTIISIILVIFIYSYLKYDTVELFNATREENLSYIDKYRLNILSTIDNIREFESSILSGKRNFDNSSNALKEQIRNTIIPKNSEYLASLNTIYSDFVIYNQKYDTLKSKLNDTISYYNSYNTLIMQNSNVIRQYKNIESSCNLDINNLEKEIAFLANNIITQDMINSISNNSNILSTSNSDLIKQNMEFLYKIEEAHSNRLVIFNNATIDNSSKIFAITSNLELTSNNYVNLLNDYSYSNTLLASKNRELESSNNAILAMQANCNIAIDNIKKLNLLDTDLYDIDKNSAFFEIKTTIELEILYNILDNVPYINYNIISNTLNKELIYYETYNKKLDGYKIKSDKDIKISKLNNMIEKEKIIFLLLLILIMSIVLFIYFYMFESLYMFILMLILIILATINYFYNIKVIVRTNYKNNYWNNPDASIKALL